MTHQIEISGCIICDIEYKDEKEAQDHFNEFRAKGDLSHITRVVKLIGVVEKVKTPKQSKKKKKFRKDEIDRDLWEKYVSTTRSESRNATSSSNNEQRSVHEPAF